MLTSRGIDFSEFSALIGRPRQFVASLLSGAAEVTPEIADLLEKVLGMKSTFWMRRESGFSAQVETAAKDAEADLLQWLPLLPLSSMRQLGWITELGRSDLLKAVACFRFFGVTRIAEWRDRNSKILDSVAYKHTESHVSHPLSLAAWLRQADIQASLVTCAPWNKSRFADCLREILPLTRQKSPALFLPRLIEICASCGVAVVLVKNPSGCHATAATRFLNPDKAMIVLSCRYLSDDHFWFAFFHEAGHLILHDSSKLFIEMEDTDESRFEDEANAFATRCIIPHEHQAELRRMRTTVESVIKFARRVGVSPGIVVGQLQHSGRLKHSYLNSLKRRYTWDSLTI
ncbi:MAG: ImmA/IrrE family metallo-endopeptidase [Verrucomicrobiaceae bacterium]|nr:ImmA/IrrE family metallo-endopeptidase [Verrucomicrobiaceae bacterium]